MQPLLKAIPANIVTGFLGAGKTTVIQSLLARKPTGERWAVLVNEFGQSFKALFTCHLPCGKLHDFNRGEFVGPGQPGQHHGNRCSMVQIWILVKHFLVKGTLDIGADGIFGQRFLEFIIRIMGHIANPAPVNNGRFLTFH